MIVQSLSTSQLELYTCPVAIILRASYNVLVLTPVATKTESISTLVLPVSIAIGLLVFSAVTFTVGVVCGVYGERRRQSKASHNTQQSAVVPSNSGPEYEEICLSGIKRVDINLTDNAAYGCTQ